MCRPPMQRSAAPRPRSKSTTATAESVSSVPAVFRPLHIQAEILEHTAGLPNSIFVCFEVDEKLAATRPLKTPPLPAFGSRFGSRSVLTQIEFYHEEIDAIGAEPHTRALLTPTPSSRWKSSLHAIFLLYSQRRARAAGPHVDVEQDVQWLQSIRDPRGVVCHRVVPSLCACRGAPLVQVPVPSRCRPVASSGRIRGSVKPGKVLGK